VPKRSSRGRAPGAGECDSKRLSYGFSEPAREAAAMPGFDHVMLLEAHRPGPMRHLS
jgi:hypothetical protein